MKEDVTFYLSVCCPALLLSGGDEDLLLVEIENFTELLMELRRVTVAEKGRMDLSFPVFLANYRRLAAFTTLHSSSSAVHLLRACDTVAARRLFRYLMCLSESPMFPLNTSCINVGQLTRDTTTSVCASILSYLTTHCIKNFEKVNGACWRKFWSRLVVLLF